MVNIAIYMQNWPIFLFRKEIYASRRILSKISGNKESHTPDGKMYSIPYLILSKQYETVIDNCKDFKELLRTQRDTLNAQYLTILNKEVQAYLGLNRYKEAAEIRETIIAITDSINSTDRKMLH